jgi:hypothetical protein
MKKKLINKNKKKAQMKIQQMSFMLIGVFLFFAMVGMIAVTLMLSHIRDSATELKEQNANLMASRIAGSPEFTCGEVYGSVKTDCIDLDKVMALKQNIKKYTTAKSNFWGVSNIEIRTLYPPFPPTGQPREVECTVANYPKCNFIQVINDSDTGFDRANYVALCRKDKYNDEIVNKCEMGQIILRYEDTSSK